MVSSLPVLLLTPLPYIPRPDFIVDTPFTKGDFLPRARLKYNLMLLYSPLGGILLSSASLVPEPHVAQLTVMPAAPGTEQRHVVLPDALGGIQPQRGGHFLYHPGRSLKLQEPSYVRQTVQFRHSAIGPYPVLAVFLINQLKRVTHPV